MQSHNHSPGETPPPRGGPWDVPFAEATFAFVDLEMTGLRLGEDRVVEVCIERARGGVNGAVEGRLEVVVDPGARRGAAHVHGLGDVDLAGAPTFAERAEEICALLDGAVLVAHGAASDVAFLHDELARAGFAGRASDHAIDTLVLCRRTLALPSYALSKVAAALEIPVARSHRAGDDVRTLRAVWDRVVVELAPATPRDLWNVRVGERIPRPAIVAALEEALERGRHGERPVEVIYRPSRRAPERLRVVVTALVPPHAIGYLLPGRGRRELRIDRILRVEPPSM